MKRILRWLMIICLSICTTSGFSQSINWAQNNSWEQVKARAKAEKKLIFLDFMATWCGPCKKMDDEVYNQAAVSSLVNEKFIAVKLQMDTTASDNAEVQSWRPVASQLAKRYKVRAYPSYLFFSPEGDLVAKDAGAKNADKFLTVLQTASDTGKVYAEQLNAWKAKKADPKLFPSMILKAESTGDKATADLLARDGINYLSKQSGKALYDQAYIVAIGPYLTSADKKLFALFYPQSKGTVTDSLIGRKVSAIIAKIVIEKDLKAMLIKEEDWKKPIVQNPDWPGIKMKMARKYDAKTTEQMVDDARKMWFAVTKPDKNEWARLAIAYHNKYTDFKNATKGTAFAVNNDMWYGVFETVEDKKILSDAVDLQLKAVQVSMRLDAIESSGDIDTYANLLHKIGRTQEAIEWQQKAIEFRKQMEAKRGDKTPYLGFVDVLKKMQAGLPTWPQVK